MVLHTQRWKHLNKKKQVLSPIFRMPRVEHTVLPKRAEDHRVSQSARARFGIKQLLKFVEKINPTSDPFKTMTDARELLEHLSKDLYLFWVKPLEEDNFGSPAHCCVTFIRTMILKLPLRRNHLNGESMNEIRMLKENINYISIFMHSLKIKRNGDYLQLFDKIAKEIQKKIDFHNQMIKESIIMLSEMTQRDIATPFEDICPICFKTWASGDDFCVYRGCIHNICIECQKILETTEGFTGDCPCCRQNIGIWSTHTLLRQPRVPVVDDPVN